MKVAIVDNNTKYIKNVLKLFSKFEIMVFSVKNFEPNLVESCDLVVLTGGSNTFSAFKTPKYYEKEINFIRKTNKPVIGICLGAQIIALAMKCELNTLSSRVSGIENIDIKKNFYIKNKIKVYESHKFAIDKSSKNVIVIARSRNGIEIIKHKTKPIYGMQFHPEISVPRNDGKKIFSFILKSILKV